jgi:hypothetical protein
MENDLNRHLIVPDDLSERCFHKNTLPVRTKDTYPVQGHPCAERRLIEPFSHKIAFCRIYHVNEVVPDEFVSGFCPEETYSCRIRVENFAFPLHHDRIR